MKAKNLEIERKYLIKMPNLAQICKTYTVVHKKIVQTYLAKSSTNRRIRKTIQNGEASYFFTEKSDITALVRVENEREISELEYLNLLKEADKSLNQIKKDRYVFPYDNKFIEIDIYPFWSDFAIAEVELDDEFAKIKLAPELELVREVTEEKAFRNFSLAKNTDIL